MGLLSRFASAALVVIALASTASAGVNTPQSGWYSGNPLLGPNALRDLVCSGSTCYAAGDFGTLLKTTKNEAARNTDTAKTSIGLGVSIEPTWYQAFAGLDLSVPLNLSYYTNDKPAAVVNAASGRSVAVGLNFAYGGAKGIKGGINYTKQLGGEGSNAYADRDFVTFNVLYSF